jgi:hypothetical protein
VVVVSTGINPGRGIKKVVYIMAWIHRIRVIDIRINDLQVGAVLGRA